MKYRVSTGIIMEISGGEYLKNDPVYISGEAAFKMTGFKIEE